jgi:CRP/FNR family transcriptional regulator, cyclic AMP receptor protein
MDEAGTNTDVPATAVGLLVLEGIMTRQLRLEPRTVTELLGPGDVLRPWHRDEVHPEVEVSWRAHEPVSLAVLDWRPMLVAAKWPVLGEALFDARCAGRARSRSTSP